MLLLNNKKQLETLIKTKQKKLKIMCSQIGKKVIVRADKAGIFFGTLVSKNGLEVQMKNVRKLYYWSGANAIEQLAQDGVRNPTQCKFTVINEEITIDGCIQINTCTKKAIENLEKVDLWNT